MTRLILLAALAALASCVAPPAPPPATPTARPVPPPAPRPLPPASQPATPLAQGPSRPVTPGIWSYAAGEARFGTAAAAPRVRLTCERGAVLLRVSRTGTAPPSLTLRATTTLRSVPAVAEAGFATAQFAARDPLLDALAFSRGRFGIIVDGVELTLPSWPEVARVLEDCRASG